MQHPPSLYRSLSKTFVLTSVIPLLLLSVVILYFLLVTHSQEIKERNQFLARTISGQVKAELSSPLTILANLRYQLENVPQTLTAQTLQQLFDQHVENRSIFDSICLLSPKGLITLAGLGSQHAGQRKNFIGRDLSQQNFYQTALHNGVITWSDNLQSLTGSGRSLALCVPLTDGQAIIGNIRLDYLETLLRKISSGQRVEVAILDHRGDLVASSGAQQQDHFADLFHQHLVQQGFKGHEGSALFVSDGISHLGSVSLIDGPGWLTLISQPTAQAYQPVSHAGILFAIGLIGAVALAMLLALFKARVMAQPFRQLIQQAEAIAAGEYTLPELSPQYQEVASLEESFRTMAGAICQREDALSRSERNYRTLAENLPAIVYRIAVQQGNRLLLLGSYQEKISGYSHDEVIEGGTALYASRVHPDDFPRIRHQIADAIGRKLPYNIEYRFCHKDGNYRHFIERGTPVFDAQDALLYLDGVVFDNSEQQRVKEILLQTEKMMSIGGLAAGMAHEINNPLAGILMNIELIRQRLHPGRAANVRRARECKTSLNGMLRFLHQSKIDTMFDTVEEAARRTAKTVENILSFSRKGQGNYTECAVVELIEQTLHLAEHNFDLKKGFDFRKIRIDRKYAPELPKLRCESSQIQQVLLNIFENCTQAMFQETAQLREPVLTITARKNGDYLYLEISDNGPGMDESVRRRIFEPFFTTKEAGQGTGLGLSISYFIVSNNHQGTISVESRPGIGSTFSICLPYHLSESKKINQL